MKVLVTGATGFLGKYVVEELAEQGYQVRAFGRNLKAGRQLEGPSVEFFAGDFTREEEIFCSLRRSGCSGARWCSLNDLGTLGAVLSDQCSRNQVGYGSLPTFWSATTGLYFLSECLCCAA